MAIRARLTSCGRREENPNTVLNLVAMYTEANHLWMEDVEGSAECLAEAAEITLEDATAEVEAVLTEPWRPFDGTCDPVVMDFAKQTLLPENPDLENVNAADPGARTSSWSNLPRWASRSRSASLGTDPG